MIKEILFKGRQRIQWDKVEVYAKQYVGSYIEVAETKDTIYLGSDLPDEYSNSKYTARLKGTMAKAKANAVQGIPEMIKMATNRRFQENQNEKHAINAKKGWYRYNSRFALPVCADNGEILRYNIFQVELVVRHSANGKMYLYDVINIKKVRLKTATSEVWLRQTSLRTRWPFL